MPSETVGVPVLHVRQSCCLTLPRLCPIQYARGASTPCSPFAPFPPAAAFQGLTPSPTLTPSTCCAAAGVLHFAWASSRTAGQALRQVCLCACMCVCVFVLHTSVASQAAPSGHVPKPVPTFHSPPLLPEWLPAAGTLPGVCDLCYLRAYQSLCHCHVDMGSGPDGHRVGDLCMRVRRGDAVCAGRVAAVVMAIGYCYYCYCKQWWEQ